MSPFTNAKQALAVIGSLSNPSKMPGLGWAISAKVCRVGSKLRNVKGSVCEGCYAMKGNYTFGTPVKSHANRKRLFEESIERDDGESWENAISFLLKKNKTKWFRWFDSGDLQSVAMLNCIVNVALKNKTVKFWLPTKEYEIVSMFIGAGNKIPSNLNIRLSGYMIDKPAPRLFAASMGCTTSEVMRDATLTTCKAQTSGTGICGSCRACWSKDVPSITYKKH